jgi:hypothetical protein
MGATVHLRGEGPACPSPPRLSQPGFIVLRDRSRVDPAVQRSPASLCSNPGPPGYVALILAFIGVKFALHGGHLQSDSVRAIANGTSLAVTVAVLASTAIVSVLKTRRNADLRPRGSLRDHPEPRAAPQARSAASSSFAAGDDAPSAEGQLPSAVIPHERG